MERRAAAQTDEDGHELARPEAPNGSPKSPVAQSAAGAPLVWPPPDEDLEALELVAFGPDAPAVPPGPAARGDSVPGFRGDSVPGLTAQPASSGEAVTLRRPWATRVVVRQRQAGRLLYLLVLGAGLALAIAAGYYTAARVDLDAPAAPPVAPATTTTSLEVTSGPSGTGVVAEAGGRETRPVTSAAEAPAVRGSLRVRAPIDLQVLIGDRVIGSTARSISMPAGRHTLQLVNERVGFRSTQRVAIEGGRGATLDVVVPGGRVNVNATPWATVWIGGRRLGDTPLANLELPAGEHEFVFRHPELGERRRVAVVSPGGTTRVAVDLRQ